METEPQLDPSLSLAALRERSRYWERRAAEYEDRIPTVAVTHSTTVASGGPASACWSTYTPIAKRRAVVVADRSARLRGAHRASRRPDAPDAPEAPIADVYVRCDVQSPTLDLGAMPRTSDRRTQRSYAVGGPVRAVYTEPMICLPGALPQTVDSLTSGHDLAALMASWVPAGTAVWLTVGRWVGNNPGGPVGGTVATRAPRLTVGTDRPPRKSPRGGGLNRVERPIGVPEEAVWKQVSDGTGKRPRRWVLGDRIWTKTGQAIRTTI